MAEIAQKEAITQQQLAEAEATYQKTIAQADRSYQAQEYRQAITTYRQALALKSEEAYPRNMIGKAEQALAALEKQQADEAEKQRQEEERINTLKLKYTGIIAEADQAFKNENYSAAKLRYTEADQLNLGEDYPVNASERSSKSSILRSTKPDWPNTIKTKHWPKRTWNRKTMLLPRYISKKR